MKSVKFFVEIDNYFFYFLAEFDFFYKRLLSYLEKDSLSLPGRLDDLEACLEQQKCELIELRKIHGESKIACDDTKLQRRAMENDIIQDKEIRDKKLSCVRRSLKVLNEEAELHNTHKFSGLPYMLSPVP